MLAGRLQNGEVGWRGRVEGGQMSGGCRQRKSCEGFDGRVERGGGVRDEGGEGGDPDTKLSWSGYRDRDGER